MQLRLYFRVLGVLLRSLRQHALTIWLVAELSFRSGSLPQGAVRLSVLIGHGRGAWCLSACSHNFDHVDHRSAARLTDWCAPLRTPGEVSAPIWAARHWRSSTRSPLLV